MARTPKNIITGQQLTTSAVTYYTAPTATSCSIRRLSFTNTSASNVTVTVYLVHSGGSVGDSTTIAKTKTLIPNQTWSCPDVEGQIVGAGGTIRALASANTAVTIIGSGTEIT